MCGIAGFHIKNPKVARSEEAINLVADKLLLGIEQRGKHATGYVAVSEDGSVVLDKSDVEATEFIKVRDAIPANVRTLLLHTRYFTKGEPSNMGNNHPVVYKSCFTIHNGSISNDDDLFREFNLKRNYEVDTEIIPAMLDKFGLGDMEHIKEALTKFRGPLAIATIDPVNHPNKLLLAKGLNSPLVVFENDNMIMWASLLSAMKDAWGAVYGTPPKQDKFKYLTEGDIIVVDGDEVVRDRYEVARPFGHQYSGASWERQSQRGVTEPVWKRRQRQAQERQSQIRRNGTTFGASGGELLWDSLSGAFSSEDEFKKAVKWYRESGKGNARVWSNRDKLDDNKDFTDVPAGASISWIPCKCGEAVLAQDMRRHIKYGHVCVDCYVVIRDKYTEKISSTSNVLDISTGKPLLALPSGRGSEDAREYRNVTDKDRENMENWAEVEGRAHKLILAAVARDSGYSPTLIDFLVFRTGAMAADFGKNMVDLKSQLTKAYHDFTPIVWEENGEALLSGATEPTNGPEDWDNSYDSDNYGAYTVKKSGGVSEVWYNCFTHGENFRAGDDCPVCIKVEDAIDEVLQNAGRDKGQCDECGLEFPKYQLTNYTSYGEDFVFCRECQAYFSDPCEVQDKQEKGAEESAKLTGLKRCPECKTFISERYPCKVCEIKNTVEPEPVEIDRLVNIKPEIKQRCKGLSNKGKPCRRKVRYCIGNIGAYCERHFKGCSEVRCVKDANTVLGDGQRVCHGHARGQIGSFADKALQKAGVVFQEVR